jgi:hypothetical protein
MTLGDAFTSAEGVDTGQAWPRVLEEILIDRLEPTPVEVLNFAITGYGPNQNAAVFREYGPRYLPDLVLVGFFVNDFFDALISNEAFQSEIGFDMPHQKGVRSVLAARQLRALVQHRLTDPMRELLTGTPRSYGFFLGNFQSFDAEFADEMIEGAKVVGERLAEIQATASEIGAKVIIVLIPASIQVCDPQDLAYFPRVIDLGDTNRFDLDRPQTLALEIADELGAVSMDLRPTLRKLDTCPYYPWNMHWLPEGHRAVAASVADELQRCGLLRRDDQHGRDP